MKSLMILTLVISFGSFSRANDSQPTFSAYSVSSTIAPTVTTIESAASISRKDKELVFAAKDDAAIFINTDGEVKSDLLQEAFQRLENNDKTRGLGEEQKALFILAL